MLLHAYNKVQNNPTNNQPKEAAGCSPNAGGRLPDDQKAPFGRSRKIVTEQSEFEFDLGLPAPEGPGDEPRARKRRQESVTPDEGNRPDLGGSNASRVKSVDEGNPSISAAGKEISTEKQDGKKEVPASLATRCKATFYRAEWAISGLLSQNSCHDSVTPSVHPPSGPPPGPNLARNKKVYLKKYHEDKSPDAVSNPESNLNRGANHE